MGIKMKTVLLLTGRLGKPERPPFLSRRAHLLTTCPQGRRWCPSLWSGRALCEADCALCGERQAMSPGLRTPVAIPCAEEPIHRFFCLRKPATGSFFAEMDDASHTVHFLLLAPKETKAPPCGAERM